MAQNPMVYCAARGKREIKVFSGIAADAASDIRRPSQALDI